jgi:four helix bundle protein
MAGKVESYRDLEVWQKAMDLAVAAYRLTESFPSHEQFGLRSQIHRAAVSVPSNVAEGHGRSITREYLHYLAIAHGSLMELETQVDLAARLGFATRLTADGVLRDAAECGRMLHGLIRRLKELAETQSIARSRR